MMKQFFQHIYQKILLFMGHIDKKALIKIFGGVVILVLLSFLVANIIGEEQMKLRVEKAGIWGPLVIIALKSLTVFIAPLSGTAIYVISGGLYGLGKGAMYNIIGNAIGISIAFFIGRIWGVRATTWLLGKEATVMIVDFSNKLADYKNLVITRILFFPLEDLINFAGGMSKIRFLPFLLISLIVTSIVGTAWVYIGDVFF